MLREKAEILDGAGMNRAIARISYEIIERNQGAGDLCVIGVLSRGAELAGRIAARISEVEKQPVPCGILDISPYRDDGKRNTAGPSCTKIDFSIQDKKVVLVDDVIYTGRSARAALDAVMALGRPRQIQLAAFVDRGHRELPIRADFVGKNLPTSREEIVRVLVKERDGADRVVILSEE